MSENNNALDSDGFVFLTIIMMILIYIAYYFLHDKFIVLWFIVKSPFVFLSYFLSVPFDGLISKMLFFWVEDPSKNAKIAYNFFISIWSNFNLGNVQSTFSENNGLQTAINKFINKSYMPYMAPFFIYFSYKLSRRKIYNKHYDKQELAEQESKLWPQTKVVLWDNPLEEDLYTGKWAMAKRPYAFLKDNNCLIFEEVDEDEYFEKEYHKPFKINFEKLRNVLIEQLSSPWVNYSSLNPYEKQIFSLLAVKAGGSKTKSLFKEYIYNLNSMYTSKKGFKGNWERFIYKNKARKNQKLIEKTILNKDYVKNIIDRHYYKYTVFIALFEACGKMGVFASSDFLWLKIKDRKLWYCLNNAGRNVAFVESAGPMCQYLAEKYIKRKMVIPMVSNAVTAFDEYMYQNYASYKTVNKYEEI